jgi:DNA (cytosine-5)-methyltransferase 1
MTFLPVGFHSNLGSRGGDVHKDKSPPVRVGHTTSNSGQPPAVCVNAREDPISISGKSLPLGAKDTGHVMVYDPSVRRLTPTECERLQGFSDGWTQVPYRNKPAADGPRYKALGNAMAVPVMRWIGERIGAQ